MYYKILAQGTKFGSGTTGLDNPAVYEAKVKFSNFIYFQKL